MLAVPAVALLALAARPKPTRAAVASHTAARQRPAGALNWPLVLSMAMLLLLYVGAEIGLGTWVSSYTQDAFGTGVVAGALVTAGYWGALGAGRVASVWLLGRGLRALALLALTLTGALAASLLLTLASGMFVLGVVGALLAGLCFGPIWSSALGIASQDASPRVPAVLVTIGNAGGLFLPLVQGHVLDNSGPRAGMAITAALCALMLGLAGTVWARRAAG
jgi:fucose permease